MGPFLALRLGFAIISALYIGYRHHKKLEGSKRPKEEEDEYDNGSDNNVIVSLYTRNVASCCSSNSSNFSTVKRIDPEHYRHWALVFEFPNTGRVITYDANEKEGYLVWSFKNSAPENVPGGKLYYNIARCRISPKELREIARQINLNYKPYNMCFRNCQDWIQSFAHELGPTVYALITKKFKSVSEKEPLMSFLIGSGNAIVTAAKSIGSS